MDNRILWEPLFESDFKSGWRNYPTKKSLTFRQALEVTYISTNLARLHPFDERWDERLRQAKTNPIASVEAYSATIDGSGIPVEGPQVLMA